MRRARIAADVVAVAPPVRPAPDAQVRRRPWQPASAVMACGLAALPKCPLCLMSLTSALGIGSIPVLAWAPRLVPLALAAVVVPLAWAAVARRSVAPLVIGVLSAGVLLADWRAPAGPGPKSLAIFGLVLASTWNASNGRVARRSTHCAATSAHVVALSPGDAARGDRP